MNILHSKSTFKLFTCLTLLALTIGSTVITTPARASINQPGMQQSSMFIPLMAPPPYSGTINIDPDIITPADPTTFLSVIYAGQGLRTMFDRRVDDWVTVNAYLFNASFSDGLSAEIQVNPEFGSSNAALAEAQKYGEVIGQLPVVLRVDIQFVWIHQGTQLFGGGNNSILIHTGQTAIYESAGILEETLVHEAAHTSLDAAHAAAPDWLNAQVADGTFISTYAQDNPTREDVAESFLPYLAVRFKSDRISLADANAIHQAIPNRLIYFDNQAFDLYPISTFADVPSNHWAASNIQRLYNAGITGGCSPSPLTYCPENLVTRDQMAVFLERGIHGASFSPPNVVPTFNDTTGNFAEDWIEALKNDGITGGCGNGSYCPSQGVTRAQMAIFLERAMHGASFVPPDVTPTFSDTAGHFAEDWIEALKNDGITSGCGIGIYCPDAVVTRAQMAVFLAKAFNLP